MSEISRVALFGKLNPICYRAIESATVFCKLRGNPYVELVHWFHQLLQLPDSDLHRILNHFRLDPGRLSSDLTAALDGLPRGASSISDLSAHIDEAVERAWVYATLRFGDSRVRSGHLVVAVLRTAALRHPFLALSQEFARIRVETLLDEFDSLLAASPETGLGAQDGSELDTAPAAEAGSAAAPGPAVLGKQEALARFTVDLTERARRGQLDPVIGRDDEVRQCTDILMRRRQNNPILVGEAGVGKTAVAEGFALRIAEGRVPPALREVSLRMLDVSLLQAGASMKGEFENRLKALIEEVQRSPKPIILFIDEAHTLVGAGGAAGTGDAANLLKPALARGTLRTIAATTWAEYKKHIEKDPALTRRFQVVQVLEPDEARAVRMIRGVAAVMEKHHQVQILDEALVAAVKLSHRYVPARQLPDKAISLLDTAAARVAVSQHAVPPPVEQATNHIEGLQTELRILEREGRLGRSDEERRAALNAELESAQTELDALQGRWDAEQALVERILGLRRVLAGEEVEGETPAPAAVGADVAPQPDEAEPPTLETLLAAQAELAALQGETPLVFPYVDEQAVAAVVSDWTGIPVGRMVSDEIQAVLSLAATLGERVIGQDHALEMIAKRVETSRAQLDNPGRPVGVFMLCGPSGVGKTETALALGEMLYGGEQNVVTINMSEFQEAHTVSTLKGAPPGYVGYGEGGVLTEAVRRRPYSVVLLDEVEKAHHDVHELFFQVFDKGVMEDGEGRQIDFRNTLILLTSNVGSDLIMNMCKDPDLVPEPSALAQALRAPLVKVFPPALLGRLIVIPYLPLSDDMLGRIIRLQLGRIEKRLRANHGIDFGYDEAVVRLIAARCTELESGGRMIDAILTNTVLPAISNRILNQMLSGERVSRIDLEVADEDFVYRFA